jgi:hypothetical protein
MTTWRVPKDTAVEGAVSYAPMQNSPEGLAVELAGDPPVEWPGRLRQSYSTADSARGWTVRRSIGSHLQTSNQWSNIDFQDDPAVR